MYREGDFSTAPRARLAALENTLGFLTRLGGQDGSRLAASSRPEVVINGPLIDMSGSSISSAAIDLTERNLLPAIERMLSRVTGKNVDFRVLN